MSLKDISNVVSPRSLRSARGRKPFAQEHGAENTHDESVGFFSSNDSITSSTSSFVLPRKPLGKRRKNNETAQNSFKDLSFSESPAVEEASLSEASTPSSARRGCRPLQRKVAATAEETFTSIAYEESDTENTRVHPDGVESLNDSAWSSTSSSIVVRKPLQRKFAAKTDASLPLVAFEESSDAVEVPARRGCRPLHRKVTVTDEETFTSIAYEESDTENTRVHPDGVESLNDSAWSSTSSSIVVRKPLQRKFAAKNDASLPLVAFEESSDAVEVPARRGCRPLHRKVTVTDEETFTSIAYEESDTENTRVHPDGVESLNDSALSSTSSSIVVRKPLQRKFAAKTDASLPLVAFEESSDAVEVPTRRGSKPLQRKVAAMLETLPLVAYEESDTENTRVHPDGVESLNDSALSSTSSSIVVRKPLQRKFAAKTDASLPSALHGRKLFQRNIVGREETLPFIEFEESTENADITQEQANSNETDSSHDSTGSSPMSASSPEDFSEVSSAASPLRSNSSFNLPEQPLLGKSPLPPVQCSMDQSAAELTVGSPIAWTSDVADSSAHMTVIDAPPSTGAPVDWTKLDERIALRIQSSIARGLEKSRARSDARNLQLRKSPKPSKPVRAPTNNQPPKPRAARIKRFKPAPWANARLYNYLIGKIRKRFELERVQKAEDLVRVMWVTVRAVERSKHYPQTAVRRLKLELAALGIVVTTYDFYTFLRSFLPQYIYVKMIPSLQPFTNMIWPPNVDNKDPSEPILD